MSKIDSSSLNKKMKWWEVQNGWDWSMSNVDIAKIINQSPENVCIRRKILGIPGGKVRINKGKWWTTPTNWNWRMSNAEIAHITGVNVDTVLNRRWRLGLNKKTKPNYWWKNPQGWHWGMSNRMIASKAGVTYHSVYTRRKILGMTNVDPTESFNKGIEDLLKGFLAKGGDIALFKSLMQQTLNKITKCQSKSKSRI